MLPLQFIRNNKDKIILRLSKRNFKNIKIIEHIISLDETCRKIQVELDKELSNANNINKQIGKLFKERDARGGASDASTDLLTNESAKHRKGAKDI